MKFLVVLHSVEPSRGHLIQPFLSTQMFPAKVATSRASLFHYYQPAFNHTFPYYKLAASASSRAVKKREKRTKLDEEVQRRMIACVDDFSVTLHCMPKSLNATRERAEEEREIVTELRYEVTGRFGVQAFDMDPLGRGFVFSTAERTCVVRIEYDGVTGKTAAVSVLPLWESREMTLPAATSLKLHPRSGALVLCHSGGVCVVRDVFSPADVPAARAAQVTALSNAPHSASGVGISQCGTCVVFAARAAGGAEGLLTAFKLFTEATTAPQKAGKRKRDDDTAPTTLTLCASPVQLLIKTTRKPVADVTACVVVCLLQPIGVLGSYQTHLFLKFWGLPKRWVLVSYLFLKDRKCSPFLVSFYYKKAPFFSLYYSATLTVQNPFLSLPQNGLPAAFVVLVDGSVAAFELASGKQVFGTSNMPHLSKGLAAPNRCDGSGDQVLLWNSVYALINLFFLPPFFYVQKTKAKSIQREPANFSTYKRSFDPPFFMYTVTKSALYFRSSKFFLRSGRGSLCISSHKIAQIATLLRQRREIVTSWRYGVCNGVIPHSFLPPPGDLISISLTIIYTQSFLTSFVFSFFSFQRRWYTVLNIGGPGYTECKSIESSSLKAERRGPAKTMLAVKRAPLQGGHIMNGGQTLLLAACSQEQYFSYAPSCFWRKQYAT